MSDLHLSATTVAAAVLWVIGGALAVLELFSNINSGAAGVTIATAAAVFNVRGYFCRMEARERNAFELGRDCEAGKVRSMH